MVQEVRVPHADAASCASYYRNHPRQLAQGDMAEARHVLFQVTPTVSFELLRDPVKTRFGLHVVQVMRRIEGRLLPFESVQSQIGDYLTTADWQRGQPGRNDTPPRPLQEPPAVTRTVWSQIVRE
ncbi:peptidylprolyl isomerase [Massilia brevitalea]|uniref:peptidylprolyl isomerase n=1 Tax=Massilia brevitalea TaxID=442526 RepID=UPI00273886D6|nr:hypothetical protein [Massilia brevitalea]